jgi:hypothetical protein
MLRSGGWMVDRYYSTGKSSPQSHRPGAFSDARIGRGRRADYHAQGNA